MLSKIVSKRCFIYLCPPFKLPYKFQINYYARRKDYNSEWKVKRT